MLNNISEVLAPRFVAYIAKFRKHENPVNPQIIVKDDSVNIPSEHYTLKSISDDNLASGTDSQESRNGRPTDGLHQRNHSRPSMLAPVANNIKELLKKGNAKADPEDTTKSINNAALEASQQSDRKILLQK